MERIFPEQKYRIIRAHSVVATLNKNVDDIEELRNVEELCVTEKKVILDAKYEKPDLKLVASEQDQLTGLQKDLFLSYLCQKKLPFKAIEEIGMEVL